MRSQVCETFTEGTGQGICATCGWSPASHVAMADVVSAAKRLLQEMVGVAAIVEDLRDVNQNTAADIVAAAPALLARAEKAERELTEALMTLVSVDDDGWMATIAEYKACDLKLHARVAKLEAVLRAVRGPFAETYPDAPLLAEIDAALGDGSGESSSSSAADAARLAALEDIADKLNDAKGGRMIGADWDVVMAPVWAELEKLHSLGDGS